jgi:hypothetical protein
LLCREHDLIFIHPVLPKTKISKDSFKHLLSSLSHFLCYYHSLCTYQDVFLFVIALIKYESHNIHVCKYVHLRNIDENITIFIMGKLNYCQYFPLFYVLAIHNFPNNIIVGIDNYVVILKYNVFSAY